MYDWRKIISEHHHRVHVQPDDTLIIRDGAATDSIDDLQQTLGIEMPEEFRSLYCQCDGFGLDQTDGGQEWWFCHPITQIPEFVTQTGSWFRKTHPDSASRFFPFIDWSNGDGMGYLLNENNEMLDGLYCFEHENYEFEEDQDSEEFIVKWNNSIYELLTDGAGSVG